MTKLARILTLFNNLQFGFGELEGRAVLSRCLGLSDFLFMAVFLLGGVRPYLLLWFGHQPIMLILNLNKIKFKWLWGPTFAQFPYGKPNQVVAVITAKLLSKILISAQSALAPY